MRITCTSKIVGPDRDNTVFHMEIKPGTALPLPRGSPMSFLAAPSRSFLNHREVILVEIPFTPDMSYLLRESPRIILTQASQQTTGERNVVLIMTQYACRWVALQVKCRRARLPAVGGKDPQEWACTGGLRSA